MIRILHVITDLDRGGAQTMLLKLLSAGGRDFDPIVVSLDGKLRALEPAIRGLGIPVHCLGLRRSFPNPMAALKIRQIVRRLSPQLIQGWMPHGNLLASFAGFWSAVPVPVVWNIRQCLYDLRYERWMTRIVIRLGAFLSARPAAIVYNSRTSIVHHEAIGYHSARGFFIANGFDCRVFRPDQEARGRIRQELGFPDDALLVGLVARYHPMKDHPTFLRAAGLVARQHANAYFVLAGSGVTKDQSALADIILSEGLQNRVFLLGERSDVACVTAALDVACSSSWTESFSNSIGEGMACGVPCVVTDVGDSAYLIADTGIVVPPRNSEALGAAIGKLLAAGVAYRDQLGTEARRRIEQEFSLDVIVCRYERLYRDCAAHSEAVEHKPLTGCRGDAETDE